MTTPVYSGGVKYLWIAKPGEFAALFGGAERICVAKLKVRPAPPNGADKEGVSDFYKYKS